MREDGEIMFLFEGVQGDEIQAKCEEQIARMDAHYWKINHAPFSLVSNY